MNSNYPVFLVLAAWVLLPIMSLVGVYTPIPYMAALAVAAAVDALALIASLLAMRDHMTNRAGIAFILSVVFAVVFYLFLYLAPQGASY